MKHERTPRHCVDCRAGSRQGGSLKLLNLTKRIEDLLSITKLLTVFDTFDSEAEAVKSYK